MKVKYAQLKKIDFYSGVSDGYSMHAILIKQSFKMHRCESDIPLFERRVT